MELYCSGVRQELEYSVVSHCVSEKWRGMTIMSENRKQIKRETNSVRNKQLGVQAVGNPLTPRSRGKYRLKETSALNSYH